MTISDDAAREAMRFLAATPKTGRLKPREGRHDFGEADSYRLKVRRIGRDYPHGARDGDFGIYLGPHEDRYVVALQAILPPRIIGCERFVTLAELRAEWELD